MRTLNFEQMENVNGGYFDVCGIANGVGGLGVIGLGLGLTTGGVGVAVIYGCATYALLCC